MTNEALFPPDCVTVVGVLNVTPDSFSDGGRLMHPHGAVSAEALREAAQALAAGGAGVLDIGAESTRPGAPEVSADEEIDRLAEPMAVLAQCCSLPVSIDTRKAAVARQAVQWGARVINDVSGLAHDPELAEVAAEAKAVLILGHMRGTPQTMQANPKYDDVVTEVATELEASVERARAGGVSTHQIVIDPGIGFGKRLEDNLQLMANLGWLRGRLGLPLLVGPSRKAFLGAVTGDPVGARDLPTHAACAVAAFSGADAVRVHDAEGARRSVAVGRALRDAQRKDLQ